MKAKRILMYNKPWDMNFELHDKAIIDDFLLTTDVNYLEEAVAVIFHMPTLPQGSEILNRRYKKEEQLWVFWSMECEAHYQWQYEQDITDLFEVRATYRMNADILVPYFDISYLERLRRDPTPKREFMNAFISSTFDQSNRIKYLTELMSFLNVHSFGKILNNKSLNGDEGSATKDTVIASYKFTIAFENAVADDYVTEKFFDPLVAGSVPVYLGAPNIEEFAPGDKCYINVNSFPSMASLAAYLQELADNEDKYQEYLQWKKLPFRDAFEKRATMLNGHPLVKLCRIIQERLKL